MSRRACVSVRRASGCSNGKLLAMLTAGTKMLVSTGDTSDSDAEGTHTVQLRLLPMVQRAEIVVNSPSTPDSDLGDYAYIWDAAHAWQDGLDSEPDRPGLPATLDRPGPTLCDNSAQPANEDGPEIIVNYSPTPQDQSESAEAPSLIIAPPTNFAATTAPDHWLSAEPEAQQAEDEWAQRLAVELLPTPQRISDGCCPATTVDAHESRASVIGNAEGDCEPSVVTNSLRTVSEDARVDRLVGGGSSAAQLIRYRPDYVSTFDPVVLARQRARDAAQMAMNSTLAFVTDARDGEVSPVPRYTPDGCGCHSFTRVDAHESENAEGDRELSVVDTAPLPTPPASRPINRVRSNSHDTIGIELPSAEADADALLPQAVNNGQPSEEETGVARRSLYRQRPRASSGNRVFGRPRGRGSRSYRVRESTTAVPQRPELPPNCHQAALTAAPQNATINATPTPEAENAQATELTSTPPRMERNNGVTLSSSREEFERLCESIQALRQQVCGVEIRVSEGLGSSSTSTDGESGTEERAATIRALVAASEGLRPRREPHADETGWLSLLVRSMRSPALERTPPPPYTPCEESRVQRRIQPSGSARGYARRCSSAVRRAGGRRTYGAGDASVERSEGEASTGAEGPAAPQVLANGPREETGAVASYLTQEERELPQELGERLLEAVQQGASVQRHPYALARLPRAVGERRIRRSRPLRYRGSRFHGEADRSLHGELTEEFIASLLTAQYFTLTPKGRALATYLTHNTQKSTRRASISSMTNEVSNDVLVLYPGSTGCAAYEVVVNALQLKIPPLTLEILYNAYLEDESLRDWINRHIQASQNRLPVPLRCNSYDRTLIPLTPLGLPHPDITQVIHFARLFTDRALVYVVPDATDNLVCMDVGKDISEGSTVGVILLENHDMSARAVNLYPGGHARVEYRDVNNENFLEMLGVEWSDIWKHQSRLVEW